MTYAEVYLKQAEQIAQSIDATTVERLAEALRDLRQNNGRLFFLGVGGSAANCSHAVNDFRKIAGIECYCPTDNVSELTARTNDEGWATVFSAWLEVSRLGPNDALFIMSVGGGDLKRNISPNLVKAVEFAKRRRAKVFGIVGRDGGFTKEAGDVVVLVPPLFSEAVTPHTEAFQAVVWHLLVSHPALKIRSTKWEGESPV